MNLPHHKLKDLNFVFNQFTLNITMLEPVFVVYLIQVITSLKANYVNEGTANYCNNTAIQLFLF